MTNDYLKLSNQICFPLYAASRLVTRQYQPYLEKLGITYPQYLVLMVLWETDGISVYEITRKLVLNTNTVTPLLKRMETTGLLTRNRSLQDERKVLVNLTQRGKELRLAASEIPQQLMSSLQKNQISRDEMIELRTRLHQLIEQLNHL